MGAWTSAVQKMAGDDPKAQLLAFFDVQDVWFNAPDVGMGGYLGRDFTLELKVDSVSRHLITGSINVKCTDRPAHLSGPFRVVNARP
jgi:hypothetical protein